MVLGMTVTLALLAVFLFLRLEGLTRDTAERLRATFAAVTRVQPRVVVHDRVVFEQSAPALELAVVTRTAEVDREFTATWLGSTKRLRLRGTYELKAGYDLRGQPFTVRLDGSGDVVSAVFPGGGSSGRRGTVQIELPPARLLGVEQRHVEVLELQNGLWNRIQPGELGDELNALTAQARQKARALDLPREAEESLTRQLRERLGVGDGANHSDRAVEIVTVPPAPAAAPAAPDAAGSPPVP